MGKINVCKKEKNMEIEEILYINLHLKKILEYNLQLANAS